MVSITLSVPAEVKGEMDRFPEINWSGFVRKKICEKTRELSWKEKMTKRLSEEGAFDSWAVKTIKRSRKGRFAELKKKGLI